MPVRPERQKLRENKDRAEKCSMKQVLKPLIKGRSDLSELDKREFNHIKRGDGTKSSSKQHGKFTHRSVSFSFLPVGLLHEAFAKKKFTQARVRLFSFYAESK